MSLENVMVFSLLPLIYLDLYYAYFPYLVPLIPISAYLGHDHSCFHIFFLVKFK